jgi:hypothetical protein
MIIIIIAIIFTAASPLLIILPITSYSVSTCSTIEPKNKIDFKLPHKQTRNRLSSSTLFQFRQGKEITLF